MIKHRSSDPKSLLFQAAALVLLPCIVAAQVTGPGLGNLTYTPEELWKAASVIHAPGGKGMNVVNMYKGYLLFGYGRDSGNPGGGFAFYDVSNPRAPKLVSNKDVNDLRESHAYGLHSYDGHDYFSAQSVKGIHIYDATDVKNPVLAKDVLIPGVSADDYSHGAWWMNWQAPYIYVARGADGVSIINAADPANATVAATTPISKTGNFEIGPLFAVGNLLIVTTHRVGGDGISSLDISDPLNPKLLATVRAGFCYSTTFNGGKVFCNSGRVIAFQVTPTSITKIGESADVGASGEYLHAQDGFIHMGANDRYAKVEIATLKIVNNSYSLPGEAEEGFANPMGNLVLLTDDHGVGSAFVVHQTEPDKAPPVVNFISPANNAVNQALTSRIGVTFTDQIILHTVTSSTFIVRPSLGGAPLAGRYSSQTNIVNFAPLQPLQPNTSYDVVIPKGGITDYMGNATAADYVSSFSTGSTVSIAGNSAAGGRISLRAEKVQGGRAAFRISGLGPAAVNATLTLSNIRGALVREIAVPASASQVIWDGLSGSGEAVKTGIYLARLRSGSEAATTRVYLH